MHLPIRRSCVRSEDRRGRGQAKARTGEGAVAPNRVPLSLEGEGQRERGLESYGKNAAGHGPGNPPTRRRLCARRGGDRGAQTGAAAAGAFGGPQTLRLFLDQSVLAQSP